MNNIKEDDAALNIDTELIHQRFKFDVFSNESLQQDHYLVQEFSRKGDKEFDNGILFIQIRVASSNHIDRLFDDLIDCLNDFESKTASCKLLDSVILQQHEQSSQTHHLQHLITLSVHEVITNLLTCVHHYGDDLLFGKCFFKSLVEFIQLIFVNHQLFEWLCDFYMLIFGFLVCLLHWIDWHVHDAWLVDLLFGLFNLIKSESSAEFVDVAQEVDQFLIFLINFNLSHDPILCTTNSIDDIVLEYSE